MKRIMATIVAIGLLGVVGSLLILGADKTWTLLRASANRAEQQIEDGLSDEQLLEAGRIELKDLKNQIGVYYQNLGRTKDQCAAEQAQLSQLERELEGEKLLLTRAKELLDDGRTSYTIAGKMVTREQLAADAQLRLGRCEQLKQRLDSQRRLVQQLKRLADEGEANFVKAQRLRQELEAQLEETKARLTTAQARQEVEEMAEELRKLPSGSGKRFGGIVRKLEERARAQERRAELLAADSKGGIVDWTGTSQPVDVGQAIDRFLSQKDGQKPVPSKAP